MNCALCHDAGVVNPPNGVCTCGLSVCLPPPRRADRVFHGERPWALPLVEHLLAAQLDGDVAGAEKVFDDIQQATRVACRIFPDREVASHRCWTRPPRDADARAAWLVSAGSLEQLQLGLE